MEKFWEKGFEKTGLSELEACTGLGRQSLYNAFGDKRQLFEKSLERYRKLYLHPIIVQLGTEGSPIANIEAVLDMWAAAQNKRGCFLSNSLAELGAREPELEPFMAKILGCIERAFRRTLEKACDAGELPEDRDVKAIARLLTTLGQGLSVVTKVEGPAYKRDAISAVRALLHQEKNLTLC